MLRASGYEVRIFTSAIEFLEQHTEQSAGCVVADLNMPEINGLELQEKLTLSHNPLPFVFLTGQADISSSVIAMRQGAEDFLAKTTPRDQLLDAI